MDNETKITSLVQAIEECADLIQGYVGEGDFRRAAVNAQDLISAYEELKELN